MAFQESRGLEPSGDPDAAFDARLRKEILLSRIDRDGGAENEAITRLPADTPSSGIVAPAGPSEGDLAAPEGVSTGPACIASAEAVPIFPAALPAIPESALQRAVWEFFNISRDVVLFLIRTVDDDDGVEVARTQAADTTVVASVK